MPRPTDCDEQLAKWDAELTAAEENPPPGFEHVYANPVVRAKFHEIGVAGKWLEAQLHTIGVDDEDKIKKFSFAFGQRCFMAPDVWDLALKTVELYKKNQTTVEDSTYVTRDYPSETAKALFEEYTKVHSK